MKIMIGAFTLFDHAAGDGSALSDVRGSVGRLLDQGNPISADEINVFFRGNKSTDLGFSISRPNDNEDAMLAMLFAHEADIPEDSDLIITPRSGDFSVSITGQLRSCGLRHLGTRTFHDYAFLGGKPRLTGAVPSTIPGLNFQSMLLSLTSGDTSKAFTFDPELLASPTGLAVTIIKPNGGADEVTVTCASGLTSAGGTAYFSAAIPASGYQLSVTGYL